MKVHKILQKKLELALLASAIALCSKLSSTHNSFTSIFPSSRAVAHTGSSYTRYSFLQCSTFVFRSNATTKSVELEKKKNLQKRDDKQSRAYISDHTGQHLFLLLGQAQSDTGTTQGKEQTGIK